METVYIGVNKLKIQGASLYEPSGKAQLIIAHPKGTIAQTLAQEDIRACLKQGGAMLFARHQARAGLSEAECVKLESDWNQRVHVLRRKYDDRDDPARVLRFAAAVRSLQPEDRIPWHWIDPPANKPHLYALYLYALRGEEAPEELRAKAKRDYEDLGGERKLTDHASVIAAMGEVFPSPAWSRP